MRGGWHTTYGTLHLSTWHALLWRCSSGFASGVGTRVSVLSRELLCDVVSLYGYSVRYGPEYVYERESRRCAAYRSFLDRVHTHADRRMKNPHMKNRHRCCAARSMQLARCRSDLSISITADTYTVSRPYVIRYSCRCTRLTRINYINNILRVVY